ASYIIVSTTPNQLTEGRPGKLFQWFGGMDPATGRGLEATCSSLSLSTQNHPPHQCCTFHHFFIHQPSPSPFRNRSPNPPSLPICHYILAEFELMGSSSFSSSSSSDGSLSTVEIQAGFSGCSPYVPSPPPSCYGSAMLGSLSSLRPRSLFFDGLDDEEDDEPRHFLDSCSLCRKPLARNRDIFMYRGDMPFCSKECRQEQIEIDEAKEKSWKLSIKTSSSRKEQQRKIAAAGGAKSEKIHVRAGTVVAG
ncbi:unnamed protein product, partial [Musa acuminata subsp. burmannicoides]